MKKTLYIGVFAFIIGNFQALAVIMLASYFAFISSTFADA